jgi:hypothetical protein
MMGVNPLSQFVVWCSANNLHYSGRAEPVEAILDFDIQAREPSNKLRANGNKPAVHNDDELT